MNNCCCAELVVDEGQQIELNVESDGGIEVGVAEQFVIGGGGNYQDKTVNITPTESAQSQTVHADVGYDALDEVEVNVAAVSDTYVGSAVPRKNSANVAINGAKFTAPAGYYASDAEKTMTTGHMSVSATKGTVSNHSVSVTPKAAVDNAGYFATGDRTGTAVSVSASELVSGTKSITQNGTGIDVTEYAAVDVAVPGQTPTGTKNISITANGTTTEDVAAYANAQIAANVPNSYTAGDEGKVVSSGALVSQTSDTVTVNDTYDTTLINSLTVNVSGGGGIDFDDYIDTPPTFPSGDYVTNVTSIRSYAFAYLAENATNALTWPEWKIHAPNCTYIGANAFRNCRTLTEAHFPSLTSFESVNYILYMPTSGTRKLAVVDWGKANLTSNTFQYANNLKTLILRKTSIATINNVNVFNGTPFANGGSGGTIYIPKSLYDHLGDGTSSDYKAATNWSTVNGYGTITWAKIEGSQYEL